MAHFNVGQNGDKVYLIHNGRLVDEMPWQIAIQLAKAILGKGKEAETHAKAKQVITDQAILMRAGVPIGFTSHRGMLNEASKMAQWDSSIRRYMPSTPGITSKEVFGIPTISQTPPKQEVASNADSKR